MIRVDLTVAIWAEDDHDADQVIRQIADAVYGPSTVRVVERDRSLEEPPC